MCIRDSPYTPPTTQGDPSVPRVFPILPAIGAVLGFTLVCVATGFLYYAFTIRRDYPDLNDPSPDVDAYWPAVEHLISQIIAGFAAIIGLPILGFSVWQFVARRSATQSPSA